jgi:hypothetical protein
MESSVFAIHKPVHAPVDQERVKASSYALLADISKRRGAALSYRFSLLSPTFSTICRRSSRAEGKPEKVLL